MVRILQSVPYDIFSIVIPVWVALVSGLSSALGLEIISTTFLLFSESFGTSYSSSKRTTEVNLAPSFVLDGSVFISKSRVRDKHNSLHCNDLWC